MLLSATMRLLILILCLTFSTVSHAARNQPYPPALIQLGQQLNLAESRLITLQRHIARQQKLHAAQVQRLQQLTVLLARSQQFPAGLWQAQAMLHNQPQQASLMPMAIRQASQQAAQLQSRLATLSNLYQQANQQADALRGLQSSLATARGKLSQNESTSLQQANLQAQALANALQQALNTPQKNSHVLLSEQSELSKTATRRSSQQSESEGGQTTDFNLTLTSPTTLTPAANTNLTLSPTLPIQGKILQGFHQSQGATAEGITLQGQAGSPVKAQVAGEVLYSGPFRQFGGLIIIKATSGHDILYGGLQTLTVNPGDTIKAGQPLGTLNPTGKLYWEIRRRGRPLNPLALNN